MRKEFEAQFLHDQRSYLMRFEDFVEQTILEALEVSPLVDRTNVPVKKIYLKQVVDMLKNVYGYTVVGEDSTSPEKEYTEITISW